MTVLNWAARSRDEEGRLLLDSNPLKGLRKPREKNPNRIVLTEDEYRALLGVSRQVGWRFHVALVLAHETGHRIGAIRKLRWSDIDFDGETIRWRAEHEKTGYEHTTPLTAEALAVLEEARRMSRGTGNRPVLPSSRDATKCTNRVSAFLWWKKVQTLAGLEPKPGLALAAAEVRNGPDGSAAQGALRAWWMEEPPDGAPLLSASRRGTA